MRSAPCALICGLFLLGLCSLGTSACSWISEKEPPLPDSTFHRMLVEIHLLTARTQQGPPPPRGVHDSLFARYDVSRDEFETTLQYYSDRPREFEELYGTVIDSLNALENRDRSSLPSTVPDSIRQKHTPSEFSSP